MTEYKDPRCKESEHEWDYTQTTDIPPLVMLAGAFVNLHCKKCNIWRMVWTQYGGYTSNEELEKLR